MSVLKLLFVLCLVTVGALSGAARAGSSDSVPIILCGHQLLEHQEQRNALLARPRPLTPQQLRRSRLKNTVSIAAAAAAPRVGDRVKFWGLDFGGYDGNDRSIQHYRLTATLKLITEHAYVYVEDGAPASARSISRLGQVFEERILPPEHKYFGTPWTPGIDNDPRVTLLVMSLNSPGGARDPLGLTGPTVGGFFNDEDEYPNDDRHPYSNEREMVTLNANLDVSSPLVLEVLAHEYQHLIHWNYDRGEELWVNEGLSVVAPTLAGFGVTLQSAFGNAVLAFGLDYDNSLTQWGDRGQDAIMSDYGAAGLFFLYLGEKYGGPETFSRIVHRPEHGIEGVLAGLKDAGHPIQFAELFTHWAVANLADDTRVDSEPHFFGYNAPDLHKLRGSLDALHDLLPDLMPKLFQPGARVKAYPAKGGASLRPQAAHYIELTGTGTLDLSFDGGGHPFEVFVLARTADGTYQPPYPLPLDPQTRTGSQKVPGLGGSITAVYLIVTNVADESGQPADYRYEARLE